jgi:CarD family transcriptional regulator
MVFKLGDAVVHPVHGVGQIVCVSEKQFTGVGAREYFEISTDKATVWIPVDASETSGLRRLTPKPDLAGYRTVLKSKPISLDKDHSKRRLDLSGRLKQGSFQALCEMVRDLTARSWSRPLGGSDAVLLRKTHDLLCQEWAAASGVTVGQAAQEVDTALLEAKRAYA